MIARSGSFVRQAAFLFATYVMLAVLVSPARAALGNETCTTAANLGDYGLGTFKLPFSLTTALDSTQSPDVDYFKVTGAPPGSLVSVTATSVPTGAFLPLSSPSIATYDSSCTQLGAMYNWYALPMMRTVVAVPADGTGVIAIAGWPDYAFAGGGTGGYRLDIKAYDPIGSISGTLWDATKGGPLDPNTWLYSVVELDLCQDPACASSNPVAQVVPQSPQNTFSIATDYFGLGLDPGTYQLVVHTQTYQTYSRIVTVAAGQNLDLGLVGLTEVPRIGSIGGTLVDADTLQPFPYYATISTCLSSDCSQSTSVAFFYGDPTGRFSVSGNWYGMVLPAGTYQVTVTDAEYPRRHPAYVSAPFSVATNQDFDLGVVTIASFPTVDSIRGRVVDALTRAPLSGSSDPLATISMSNCNPLMDCQYVWGTVDASGKFIFDKSSIWNGGPLFQGGTTFTLNANQYQTTISPQLTDSQPGSTWNVGDLGVTPNPVRMLGTKPCANVPTSGGTCRFSVTLVNGYAAPTTATVWSTVTAWGIGSFWGSSNFALDSQTVTLPAGTSGIPKTVKFELVVPAAVADYAWFTISTYIGEGRPNPYLQTVGGYPSFTMIKDPNAPSYRPVSEKEGKELMKSAVDKLSPKSDDRRRIDVGPRPVRQGPPQVAPAK